MEQVTSAFTGAGEWPAPVSYCEFLFKKEVTVMSKPRTNLAIVLDQSGSMKETRQAALDDFNEQVQQAKLNSKDQDIRVCLVTFNGDVWEHLWLVPATELNEATLEDYEPDGNTAFRDGVGYTIQKLLDTTDPNDKEQTFVVAVISDGKENWSQHVQPAPLAKLITSLQATQRWTFSYMGCSKEILENVAAETGIPINNMAVWSNKTHKLAVAGLQHKNSRMNDYYRARSKGKVKLECLYSDDKFGFANFDNEVVNPYVPSQNAQAGTEVDVSATPTLDTGDLPKLNVPAKNKATDVGNADVAIVKNVARTRVTFGNRNQPVKWKN